MAACANAVLCNHAKELSADAKGALSDREGGGERMDPDVAAVMGGRRTAVERYKVKVGKFCCFPPNICSWRPRRARGSSESGGAHCPKPRTRPPQSGVGPHRALFVSATVISASSLARPSRRDLAEGATCVIFGGVGGPAASPSKMTALADVLAKLPAEEILLVRFHREGSHDEETISLRGFLPTVLRAGIGRAIGIRFASRG